MNNRKTSDSNITVACFCYKSYISHLRDFIQLNKPKAETESLQKQKIIKVIIFCVLVSSEFLNIVKQSKNKQINGVAIKIILKLKTF